MATLWPPKSPKAALLSSPSGRRKYRQAQEHPTTYTSPLKQTITSPKLQRTSHRLFDKYEDTDVEDMEEDEETLQLKLAAIEAKLKLKKLQQSKARSQAKPPEATIPESNSPPRFSSTTPASRLHERKGQDSIAQDRESAVQVPISPTKKTVASAEQRSPGRVLLGIDKGIRGDDVSLRRARTNRDGTLSRVSSRLSRPLPRPSAFNSVRTTTTSSVTEANGHISSFSEKMADSRSAERSKADRRETIIRNRSTGFKLNQVEMEGFCLAAEEARAHSPPKSVKHREVVEFRRDDILRSYGERKATFAQPKRDNTVSNLRNPSKMPAHSPGDDGGNTQKDRRKGDASLFEPFSQLHLSSRILPHTFLQRTLPDENYTSLCLPELLKSVHAPLYELPESVVDYVVFGIVASKSSPQDHKAGTGAAKSAGSAKGSNDWEKQWEDGSLNQKKFMVLQLTDLTWSVDIFLFGTALPRYHRLSLGTVVAILNPGIMPPKKGKEDTGAFSLTLHSGDDTVLEIGTARDLGFCKAVRKDGKECGSWVNSAKTEYCEWHLNAQVSKVQAGRMGVNTGSDGSVLGQGGSIAARNRLNSVQVLGRGREINERHGLLPRKEGQRFDTHTGNHYFIASSGGGSSSGMGGTPVHHSDRTAANLLDMDDGDPFIAEGQLSRDKESRLRKRLVAEEKERSIARTLAKMNTGGAGGEYIRRRLGVDSSSASEQGSQKSTLAMKVGIMNSDRDGKGHGKRSAESVRLSPMKKTRLLTDKGIRHPGRESVGARNGLDLENDDDDELDIV